MSDRFVYGYRVQVAGRQVLHNSLPDSISSPSGDVGRVHGKDCLCRFLLGACHKKKRFVLSSGKKYFKNNILRATTYTDYLIIRNEEMWV